MSYLQRQRSLPIGMHVYVGENVALIKRCDFNMAKECYVYQLEWTVDNGDGTVTTHLTPGMVLDQDFKLTPTPPENYGSW
jgi:hypothetical protein